MKGEGYPQSRVERPVLHSDHIAYVQEELSLAQHVVAKYANPRNARNEEQEQRARARLALLQPIPEQLARGEYHGMTRLLTDDIVRTNADIAYLQRQLQGKLEGDDGPNGFFTLQEKRLKASGIKVNLTAKDDRAFMDRLDAEWKEDQAHTKRGQALLSLAQSHAKLAHMRRLQQNLTQSVTRQ